MEHETIISIAEKNENIKKWITTFRRNPQCFIEDYIGLKLHPYQKLDLYAIAHNTNFAAIRSRATAKSFEAGLIGLWACVMFPNSQVCIVSSTKGQAGIIITEKIQPLAEKYENLAKEIKSITANNNTYEVKFKNGSKIFVVPLAESSRGERCTMIIYEEFRILDKQKIDSIISPFKVARQVPYLANPKYRNLIEESKEIYISSSGYSTESWYGTIETLLKEEIRGKDSIVFFGDFFLAVRHRIKTIRQIADERRKLGNTTFEIEYQNLLMRENKDAFFNNELFKRSRILKQAFYPQHKSRYIANKNILAPVCENGEIIILSIDIANKAGHKNDNTIVMATKLIPTKKGYVQQVFYIETMNGQNTLVQTARIKEIWKDLNVSYIVLDTNGSGIGEYDALTSVTNSEERGVEYPAFTTMWHESISKYEDYKKRTKSINAMPIIYPMWATQEINSSCAYLVREQLQNDMIQLMINPLDGEEYLFEKAKYFDVKKDMNLRAWFLSPYYQTTALQGEMCALKAAYNEQKVKMIEPSNGRKDRYTALAYQTYFVYNVLNPLIMKETKQYKLEDMVVTSSASRQPTSNKYFNGRTMNSGNTGRKLFGR